MNFTELFTTFYFSSVASTESFIEPHSDRRSIPRNDEVTTVFGTTRYEQESSFPKPSEAIHAKRTSYTTLHFSVAPLSAPASTPPLGSSLTNESITVLSTVGEETVQPPTEDTSPVPNTQPLVPFSGFSSNPQVLEADETMIKTTGTTVSKRIATTTTSVTEQSEDLEDTSTPSSTVRELSTTEIPLAKPNQFSLYNITTSSTQKKTVERHSNAQANLFTTTRMPDRNASIAPVTTVVQTRQRDKTTTRSHYVDLITESGFWDGRNVNKTTSLAGSSESVRRVFGTNMAMIIIIVVISIIILISIIVNWAVCVCYRRRYERRKRLSWEQHQFHLSPYGLGSYLTTSRIPVEMSPNSNSARYNLTPQLRLQEGVNYLNGTINSASNGYVAAESLSLSDFEDSRLTNTNVHSQENHPNRPSEITESSGYGYTVHHAPSSVYRPPTPGTSSIAYASAVAGEITREQDRNEKMGRYHDLATVVDNLSAHSLRSATNYITFSSIDNVSTFVSQRPVHKDENQNK
ncbi:unnamed protein product [Calicophoron daubneyi]|uniref:Uncharacterized protein n=1 Tax=Calicophoron daubneyi TaxID=300641 RepID=A0AAV2SVR5_CALDB